MAPTRGAKAEGLEVPKFREEGLEVWVVGKTPFICNRLPEKARQQLLYPLRKSRAQQDATDKHDPVAEFRSSVEKMLEADSPTVIGVMGSAFKRAMATAALDIPGAAKSQIGRLVWVEESKVSLYGTPMLLCSIVRSADMAHTPDVRTRAILPEWAAKFTIRYAAGTITAETILRLLTTAGRTVGVGDWRPQKGSGTYGQFDPSTLGDSRLPALMKQGRAVQAKALEAATPYDEDTSELLGWFLDEVKVRGKKVA